MVCRLHEDSTSKQFEDDSARLLSKSTENVTNPHQTIPRVSALKCMRSTQCQIQSLKHICITNSKDNKTACSLNNMSANSHIGITLQTENLMVTRRKYIMQTHPHTVRKTKWDSRYVYDSDRDPIHNDITL